MTTITLDNFQAPVRDVAPAAPSHSVKKILFISLLLHIALLLAIALNTRPQITSVTQPEPISARLIYAPTPQVNAPPVPTDTQYDNTENRPSPPVQAESPVVETGQAATVELESSTLIETQKAEAEAEQTPSRSAIPPPSELPAASGLSLGDINAAREMIRQQQAQAIQRDARQAAADYQRLKTRPELIDPRKGREEERPEVKRVEVNCDNTTNAIIASLSELAGGTLRCSERNDFEKFIEKRVNKNN